jgi:hypothetical protein
MCVANIQCVDALRQLPLPEMVLVTGAGLSVPGCGNTQELADAIHAACDCNAPETFEHVRDFFQAAHDADPDSYYQTIRDQFSGPLAAAPKIYAMLVAANFRAYINLNYDRLLLDAMLQSRGSIDGMFTPYPNPEMFKPWALHSQRIVAIHGFADGDRVGWERELILKRSDYEFAYTNHQNVDGTGGLLDWWCDLLSRWPCLFIGTSLDEPGIRSAVNSLLREKRIALQEHIVLVSLPQTAGKDVAPPIMDPLLKTIRRVPYHPEDARHRGLLRIWQELSGTSDLAIPIRREPIAELRLDETEEVIP